MLFVVQTAVCYNTTLSNHPECMCDIRHLHRCRQNMFVLHLQAKELGGVLLDEVLIGEGHLLELLGVRSGNLSTGDTDGRSVQVVKGVFGGESNDLGGDTEGGEARLNGHHGTGLLDGVDDGLEVEGLDGTEVDDLSLNAVLLLESLSGNESLADAAGEGDDGKILASALNLGLADLFRLLASKLQGIRTRLYSRE
jgi:hypothetical protein